MSELRSKLLHGFIVVLISWLTGKNNLEFYISFALGILDDSRWFQLGHISVAPVGLLFYAIRKLLHSSCVPRPGIGSRPRQSLPFFSCRGWGCGYVQFGVGVCCRVDRLSLLVGGGAPGPVGAHGGSGCYRISSVYRSSLPPVFTQILREVGKHYELHVDISHGTIHITWFLVCILLECFSYKLFALVRLYLWGGVNRRVMFPRLVV